MTCDHDFSSYGLNLETDKIYPLNTKWKFSDRTKVCQATERSSEMLKTVSDLGCYVEYIDKSNRPTASFVFYDINNVFICFVSVWENIVQGISGYYIC